MILKHRDTQVLRFDWVRPFGVKNVEVNSAAERFLPLAFRDRVRRDPTSIRYELEMWLLSRTPPLRRAGIRDMLHRLCSTCPLFTSDKTGYLPALHVMDREAARRDVRFADIHLFDAVIFNNDRHLGNFGFLVDNDTNELNGIAPIFDNGYGLFAKAISEHTRDNEFKDLRRYLARTGPKLLENWLAIPGGVTDEMIDRLKGMENFEFKPHPDFTMPDNRLELSQYFLRNRIDKIIRYREKADSFLNIRRKDVTINPMLGDKQLKKAEEAEDLRRELRETLKSFPKARTEKLAILFKTTTRTIARHIKALQDAGELRRVGSRKTGYWQVIEQSQADGN